VIALGKLGGHELNYSPTSISSFSTIRKRCPGRAREDPGQAALRIGQRLVELLRSGPRKAMPFASICGFGRRLK
jgi:glutamate-ammonia-ligase adenylyltransferase